MIQHRGPLKKLFVYSVSKSKNKKITAQPQLVLNLKRRRLYFSKQTSKERTCLKKISVGFVKKTLFLLEMLLVDFTIPTKQKFIKKINILYKNTFKKTQNILKHANFFIKNTIFIYCHKTI